MMAEPLWSHRFSSKSSILFCVVLGVTFTLCSQVFYRTVRNTAHLYWSAYPSSSNMAIAGTLSSKTRLSTGYMLIALPTAIAVGCVSIFTTSVIFSVGSKLLWKCKPLEAGSKSEARVDNIYQKAGLRLPMAPMFQSSWWTSFGRSPWRVWRNARSPLRAHSRSIESMAAGRNSPIDDHSIPQERADAGGRRLEVVGRETGRL